MMLQIIECDQGTDEWLRARMGIPTASCFKQILAKGEGKTRRSYMLKLAGEILTGEPMEGFSNQHTERGHEMEPEARDLYAFMRDAEPQLIGFIRNGQKGCSPDSLIGANGMLEIKTKLPHLQIDCLLSGGLPSDHKAQCQGQLWIAEREWLDFVSYWPKLPLHVVRVHRDEEYIAKLAQAVDEFNDELAHMVEGIRGLQPQELEAA
jgi:hypothetical protein